IRLEVSSRASGLGPISVSLGRMVLLPGQKQGKLVFVFDDGYQSILPAAQYMREKSMRGDVAAIGKYVDNPTPDHLNLYQLKSLQNNWGWDIVNHTQEHVDAVQSYYDNHDLGGYASDILQQAAWLEANHLNSAPNWLIYPHGSINEPLEHVVSRYYMFARVVADNPDASPYGDPHAISDFEIQYPGDGEGGDVGYTPPSEVLATVHEAIAHHLTVILTFHRIHSEASDPPGYPLALFKRVVNGISASGIKVMTLSQLDRSNGVPTNNHIYVRTGRPSQITVNLHG
ncbi:MAG: polysaccharide deacetylase family protein, partial [Gammaproteobacteria bacterium]